MTDAAHRGARWLARALGAGALVCATGAFQCNRGGAMTDPSSQRDFQTLFGAPLPADASDVRVHRHQPSTDLSLHVVYARLRTSQAGYLALLERLGLTPQPGATPALRARLPAAWKLVAPLSLPWWDATLAIPDDTALRQVDRGAEGVGFLAAKYENGHAYLVHKGR